MRAPRHRHVTPYFLRCAGEAIVLDLSGKDICDGLRPRARARRSEKIKHTSHTIYQLDPSLSSTNFYMTLLRSRLIVTGSCYVLFEATHSLLQYHMLILVSSSATVAGC